MKKHLRGLDTLRAVAAMIVVVGHIELLKLNNDIPNLNNYPYFKLPDGHLSVILFFVISGFLITYLLIDEKTKRGQISLSNFYKRRIFRIWPLYYLILILSFLFFRTNYNIGSIFLCLGIFPNIAHALNIGWETSPQIWSIGVEEQFYLFWPVFIILLPYKKVLPFLILFFIGYTLMPQLINFTSRGTFESNDFMNRFFYTSKFNCMSIGCILGFMYATKNKRLKLLYNKYIAYTSLLVSFFFWFFGFELKYFNDEFYSIIFGIMIINIATNENFINIDTSITIFLGKISYGIYMYHWMIILFVIKALPYNNFGNDYLYNFILYITVISVTIVVSWISYIGFEKYFLKMNEKSV